MDISYLLVIAQVMNVAMVQIFIVPVVMAFLIGLLVWIFPK